MSTQRRPQLRDVSRDAGDPWAGKLPPHNLAAEEACVAAAVLYPEQREEIQDLLAVEHFYSPACAKIWAAIVATAGRVDDIAVIEWLRANEELERIGGPAELARIIGTAPAFANIRAHATIVVNLWRRRELQGVLHRALAASYVCDGQADPGFEDTVLASVTRVTQQGVPAASVWMADAMVKAHERVWREVTSAGDVTGLPTGIPGLDARIAGLHAPEFTVLKARTKDGKSTLARLILSNIAGAPRVEKWDGSKLHGYALRAWCEKYEQPMPREPPAEISIVQGSAYFSLEMQDWEVARDLAYTLGRVDSMRIGTRQATDEDMARFDIASDLVRSMPIKIVSARGCTQMQVRAQLRQIRAEMERLGIRLAAFAIDTFQLMADNEPAIRDDENGAQRYDRTARALGQTAVDFSLPCLALSQVNQNGTTLGASAIQMHAHNVWKLSKNDKRPQHGFPAGVSTSPVEALLEVELTRHGAAGPVPLWFTPAYTLFTDGSHV